MAFKDDDTPMLLRMYYGLAMGRSVKKADVRDELVHRGVSIVSTNNAIHEMLFAIGWAADNRLPEVDDGNGPDKADLDHARKTYTFRLDEVETGRCYDCKHATLGRAPVCHFDWLDIGIANVQKSRCPLWEEFDRGVNYGKLDP